MIKKTGREIHRLRKAKLGHGELDKHMFQEKMAFLTTSKCQVPPLLMTSNDYDNNDEDVISMAANFMSSRSSTLKHDALAAQIQTHELDHNSSSSSTCSTPTPHLKNNVNSGHLQLRNNAADQDSSTAAERFSYEIDPDIGVIV